MEVYLDSSVIGALVDEEPPGWKETTRSLFDAIEQGDLFAASISTLVVEEVMRGPERVVSEFRELARRIEFDVLDRTPEAEELATRYLAEGILPKSEKNDALHLAMATVAGIGLVLSWNFSHMVNVARIRAVNGVNLINGYGQIDVRSPEEVPYARE